VIVMHAGMGCLQMCRVQQCIRSLAPRSC
jgi:hypothetical protein